MIQVGDIIKSYDFSNRTDCYVIGHVNHIANDMIHATVVKAVSLGETYRFPDTEFCTPVLGLGMFDDLWTRIEVIG